MGASLLVHWTQDEVNLLTSLWNQGQTATVIAGQLGKSRNSVIGKAHRLKLNKRAPTPAKKGEGRRRVRRAPAPSRRKPTASAAIFVAPAPILPPQKIEGGVSILDLEHHHCRAIVGTGDDGMARYCGGHKAGMASTGHPSSYCAEHGAKYYQMPRAR